MSELFKIGTGVIFEKMKKGLEKKENFMYNEHSNGKRMRSHIFPGCMQHRFPYENFMKGITEL